ncbi:FAD:protein FMN transferase [soil metagenome]
MRTETFSALGCSVTVSVVRAADLARAGAITRRTLSHVDATCSRFRQDSDLSRVNRAPGAWVAVDPLLVAAVDAAVEAARRTDGLVHPLLGRDLVHLGYDCDLHEVQLREALPREHDPVRRPDLLAAWQLIRTRPDAVRVPEGTALDLGSIGKAWAADLVTSAFDAELGGPAAVSVGGDVSLSTSAPAWPVTLDGTEEQVLLHGGGMATSSTRLRRWRQAGVTRHHLLDPRTGMPVPEVWATATVTGPTCVAANTASTAAIVLGEAAPAWLATLGTPARLTRPDGRVVLLGDWPSEHRRSA